MIDTEARVVRQVYEHYTVAGWSIGAITRWLNDQRRGDAQAGRALGALDGLGDAAQPRLSRHGLLRQDPRGPAPARDATPCGCAAA